MTDDQRHNDLPSPGEPDFNTLILAYADGELTEADMARAEALLDRSPEARDLYESTIDQMDALSDLFDQAAAEMSATAPDPFASLGAAPTPAPSPAPTRVGPAPERRRRSDPTPRRSGRLGGIVPLALTAAAALVAGVALGPLLTPSAPEQIAQAPSVEPTPAAEPVVPGWRMSVATYQRLYTAATFASAPVLPEANVATWTNAAPLFDLEPNAVDLPPGLELKRMQLLEINGRPLLQIAFVAEGGRTVSLCIFPRGDGGGDPAPDLVAGEILDLNTIDWKGSNNAYLLIGDADAPAMERFAATFADQLI